MTYGFDDCDDVDMSVCEWIDPDTYVTHSEECEVFAEWWEEYLRCLPEVTETDCNDEGALNSCTATVYYEPCSGVEICSVELEDYYGSYGNITCDEATEWQADYTTQDFCRWESQYMSCEEGGFESDEECSIDIQFNTCNVVEEYDCSIVYSDYTESCNEYV